LSIDLDPFPEIFQMGGGIQAHFVPGLLKNGGQHMATGTFAIGTGHMDAFEFLFGISQMGGEVDDIVQLCIQGHDPLLLVHGQLPKHPIQRFPVGHCPNLKLTTTKPICWAGALGSGFHRCLRAVSLAGFKRQGSVLVDPLTPGVASMTLPSRPTTIWTTTVPAWLHSCCTLP